MPLPNVSRLRQKLYQNAKQEPAFRFYPLYEAVCREDVLGDVWLAVRKNVGRPGVDRVTFEQIKASPEGVAEFLGRMREIRLSGSTRGN